MHKVSIGKPEGMKLFEDLGVDERIILKWVLKVYRTVGLDWIHGVQTRKGLS
jgi:hypothetical protein